MISYTLYEPYEYREDIKKSRFIAYITPINSLEQANAIIADRSDHTAAHNCWAWRFGQQYRFNDDGEPSGTAGKPILTAIKGKHCDRVLALITRWFGGIKLGTGGLSRAYSGVTARCLQQAKLIAIVPHLECKLYCNYNEWPILENKLQTINALILEKHFVANGAVLKLTIPEQQLNPLQQWLNNLTRGRIKIQVSTN